MKAFLLVVFALCTCSPALSTTLNTAPAQAEQHQQTFLTMPTTDSPTSAVEKVPGHNNATYGPTPKSSQIMDIEFLEIAPLPVVAYVLSRSLSSLFPFALPSPLPFPPNLNPYFHSPKGTNPHQHRPSLPESQKNN